MTRRWMIVIVAVCLVVTVAAIAYAAGKTTAPEVIRAQRFELVDAEGRVRIEMSIAGLSGQAPGIRLLDEKGTGRAGLVLFRDGRPGLALSDEKGAVRAGLGLLRDGRPIMTLSDEKGEARAALSLLSDGSPILWLRDEKGKLRATLAVFPDGNPILGLYDEKGKSRATLGLLRDGGPSLTFCDEKGRSRAELGVSSLETIRTGAVEKRAESSLVLFDKDGKVLWAAP